MKTKKVYVDRTIVEKCFKKYACTAMKNYKYAYYKKENLFENNELLVDEFYDYNLEYSDKYFFEEYEITIMDSTFFIKNELLYEGLIELDEISRTVFYLHSCENLSDRIIGERMNIHGRTVQRIRKRAQQNLLKKLKGALYE